MRPQLRALGKGEAIEWLTLGRGCVSLGTVERLSAIAWLERGYISVWVREDGQLAFRVTPVGTLVLRAP